MSARNLDCLDFGELAAFLATNRTPTALDAVLASLADRSGGKVRRLVSTMRETVAAIAEQPAAEPVSRPKRRRKAVEPVAAADGTGTVCSGAATAVPARVVDTASLPHYVDPDDGREDRRDTPHPSVAELCRDKVPTGAVRRRDPGLKHYSPPGIGYTREMKAGRAHDRRLAAAVLDATGLHVPPHVSWFDHLRDCAARHGVSLRCSLIPAVTEAYRELEAPRPARAVPQLCPAEWHGLDVKLAWNGRGIHVTGGYKSIVPRDLYGRTFASEADAWDAIEAAGFSRPKDAPVNFPPDAHGAMSKGAIALARSA